MKNRFGLEDHSFTAAERPVIDCPVPIRCETSQVMDSNINESILLPPPDYSEIERTFEKLRKYRDNVKLQQIWLHRPVFFPRSSFVEIPQPFGQIYFDPALIQIDLSHVRLRERNQCLLILAINFQNLAAAGVKNVRDRSDVFAVDRKYLTTSQLGGIKPALFRWGPRIRRNFDFAADVFFSFRNRVDSLQLRDAASVLPAKELYFTLLP
jgi:hypothetical protein